eukprot:TRINITY_DN5436_c0_g1_i6.p1 TRINITY_DN5436_c0_g1~~TRINITY_DN5436_c0_g1_i6.p1  ORF type:complete len:241 (+),score=63.86 TRINITY_DN5436_c0_g1_i6:95-817(+)
MQCWYKRKYRLSSTMEKRHGVLRGPRPYREPQNDVPSAKQELEKRFLSFTGGRRQAEFRSLRYLLKDLCGIALSQDKERELAAIYKLGERDPIDFEIFYELSQMIRDGESSAANNEELDYVDAFVALGGDPNKHGTISREKLVSVLLNDFELTLDMDKYMEVLGEGVTEIDYDQFCILLNDRLTGNPSRFSSFLAARKMTGALSFFKQLNEDDEDFIKSFEDEAEIKSNACHVLNHPYLP